MLSVAEFRSLDELANVRLTWKSLWDQTPDANYFQSYDWLRSYWRFYGEGLKLKVLLVSMAAKPIGLVPLVIKHERTQIGVASVLTFPVGEWGAFYGQVGPNPVATFQGAMPHIFRKRADWNVIELPCFENTEENRRLKEAMSECGLQTSISGALRHPKIRLQDGWDEYLADLTPPMRLRLSQAEHALRRVGPLSFHRWRPTGASDGKTVRRWDLLQHVADLKRASDQCSSRADIELAFIRDAHPGAVDLAAVDLCTLNIGRRTIAAAYSYISNGILTPVLFVTDPQYAVHATDVLMGYLVRDGFMRQDEEIVFRTEHQDLAAGWTNDAATALTYGYYAWMSPQAQMLRLKQNRKKKLKSAHGSIPTSGVSDTATTVQLFSPS